MRAYKWLCFFCVIIVSGLFFADQVKADKEVEALGGKIPVYKGAKITKSLSDDKRTIIQMESGASPEDIMNFYKIEMTGKGWIAKVAKANKRSASLMMNKESLTLMLSAGPGKDGKTMITIRISGE